MAPERWGENVLLPNPDLFMMNSYLECSLILKQFLAFSRVFGVNIESHLRERSNLS